MSSDHKKLQLYSFWNSSCAHRVRFALNLKGLDYEYKAVDLWKGEQHSLEYEKVNPVKFVPALVDEEFVVSDSLAILLYLDEKYPQSPLLPKDLKQKALNLQIASIVGSSIQPMQLIYQKYVKPVAKESIEWLHDHTSKGFKAIEKLLDGVAGKFALGDEVQLADIFLAPQIYAGAKRFQLDMSGFPILSRLFESYMELPTFQASLREVQPDAPSK